MTGARRAVSVLLRAAPALSYGLLLAACLEFVIIPVVLHLYAARHGLAGIVSSRIIDSVFLALNGALLVALFSVRGLRRGKQRGPGSKEAPNEDLFS